MTPEKRLSICLPQEVAAEICQLSPIAKALLLVESSDQVLETIDGFLVLDLSATTTQWLKSLTTIQTLQLVENLSLMLMSEVQK